MSEPMTLDAIATWMRRFGVARYKTANMEITMFEHDPTTPATERPQVDEMERRRQRLSLELGRNATLEEAQRIYGPAPAPPEGFRRG